MHERRRIEEFRLKVKRIVRYRLPVDPGRGGECVRCGACCRFVVRCPFLAFDEEEKATCRIYRLRPRGCRKYPRIYEDQVTRPTCGFTFPRYEGTDHAPA